MASRFGQFEDEILATFKMPGAKADIMAKAAGVNITGIFRMSDVGICFICPPPRNDVG